MEMVIDGLGITIAFEVDGKWQNHEVMLSDITSSKGSDLLEMAGDKFFDGEVPNSFKILDWLFGNWDISESIVEDFTLTDVFKIAEFARLMRGNKASWQAFNDAIELLEAVPSKIEAVLNDEEELIDYILENEFGVCLDSPIAKYIDRNAIALDLRDTFIPVTMRNSIHLFRI